MTLETLAEVGHDFSVPRFAVEVGRTTFDETSGLFSEVSVDRTIDGADRFSLTIAARFDHEDGRFVGVDWETFAVGESVEIAVGYGATLSRVLTGAVTEQSTEFPAGGAPTITVSGYGRYHELTGDVTAEQWTETTDGEIVEAIAAAHGFEPTVDDTAVEHDVIEVEHDSDAAFIETKLVERNDDGTGPFEAFARLDELVFRAPRDASDPSVELRYGESLGSFSPELTEARTPERVEVRDWDPRRKRGIVGVAEREDGSGTRVVRRPVDSTAEADRIAEAIMGRAEHDRLTGTGRTAGLPEIEIGEPIELSGIGRFSGTYYLETVTHTLGSDGYTTSFTVREAVKGVFR